MVTLSDIKDRAKQAISTDGDDSGSGAERIDQEQARIERAREEAREEARRQAERERVQERVEDARDVGEEEGEALAGDEPSTATKVVRALRKRDPQTGRRVDAEIGADDSNGNSGTIETVTQAIETATDRVAEAEGEGGVIENIDKAMATDFDGDGEPFAGELGLQTNDRAEIENQAFGTLDERVTTNEQNISQLEGEVFGSSRQQATANVDRMSPGGVDGMGASAGAGAGLDGGLEPINGLGGLGGPDVGGPSGGLSGGSGEVDDGAANESVVETAGSPGLREMGIDPEDGL